MPVLPIIYICLLRSSLLIPKGVGLDVLKLVSAKSAKSFGSVFSEVGRLVGGSAVLNVVHEMFGVSTDVCGR